MKLDSLLISPIAPELLINEAKAVSGLDLLGLRAPAEAVAVRMMDGVTTITPLVRYLGFRAWLIFRYLKLGGLNDWQAFSAFAAKAEAAVAFASRLAGDSTRGVIGYDVAAPILAQMQGELTLKRLTKILAVSVYAGSSEALGLGEGSGEVPSLTRERGLPLAESFDTSAGQDDVLQTISLEGAEQDFERERLARFGRRFSMAAPSAEERQWLLGAILPFPPRRTELPRIASYCLLLHLCRAAGREVKESEVLAAVSGDDLDSVPEELHFICDGWTRFTTRDILVLAHEAAVWNALQQLLQVAQAERRQSAREVIAGLIAADLDSALAGVGLKLKADAPVRALYEAVLSSLGPTSEARGLRRWKGELGEALLFEKAEWFRTPAGLSLLPVTWIIAARRMEPGIKSRLINFDLDGLASMSRIGIGAVVLPEVAAWSRSTVTIRETTAWLVQRSVDQHLRIAWSRMAREPQKDVALIRSDGDDWIHLKDFRPGRAVSRLYQAINWLRQLDLIRDGNLTADGSAVLNEGLATIRRFWKAEP